MKAKLVETDVAPRAERNDLATRSVEAIAILLNDENDLNDLGTHRIWLCEMK
jgi:hypothetical protein